LEPPSDASSSIARAAKLRLDAPDVDREEKDVEGWEKGIRSVAIVNSDNKGKAP
jgi:hypothetical protein